MDVSRIYQRRFTPDLDFRRAMWAVLCRHFFQGYVPAGSTVLEIGAGYCEFINQIAAGRKLALDINPDTRNHAAADVEVVLAPSTAMTGVLDSSVDVVFASNFFEHLTRPDILATLAETERVLRAGGRLVVLQPNIRFCGRDYWMFFDHLTPIDDRALVEAMVISGLRAVEVIPRFLPYTTHSRLPRSILLIRLYLKLRPAWRWFGQQSLLVAEK
jgi:ubiquinone/menaquinone biosynthesis C-methylase UbiE